MLHLISPSGSLAGASLAGVGIFVPIVAALLARGACQLSGRASAAGRHLIWTLAFVIMAVGIPVTLFPIKVAVPILPASFGRTAQAALSRPMVREMTGTGTSHLAIGISDPRPGRAVAVDPAMSTPHAIAHWLRGQSWTDALLGLWLLGFLFLLFAALAGILRLRGVVQRSRSMEDQAALWAELLSLTGLRQSVRLVVSSEVRIPLVTGVWHPIVILPEAALDWPAQMLRAALIHELAHLRRNDLLCFMFARLVASIYWFNPAAWYGLRSLQGQAEMAADDGVVVTESEPVAYAESLLGLVRNFRGSDGSLFAAIGMLHSPGIEARVERILDPERRRLGPPRIVRLGALFCGALATAIVLMVRPVVALPTPVLPELRAAPHAVHQEMPDNGGATTRTEPSEAPAITDLRTDLPGTRWKATPGNPLRGGLAATLTFTGNTVAPAGYHYDVNRHDGTVRIFFNHGDTQLLLLTDDGRRLRFNFLGRDYAYELTAK